MRNYLWVFLAIAVASCDIFDKEEPIPGYVYIESADLSTDETTEGANTSKIVDATVYADDEFMGTFELPAKVPILKNGNVNIRVAAGILNNGLSSDRQIYPFYEFYEEDVVLRPHEVTVLSDSNLTFRYFQTGVNFEIENFEFIGFALEDMDENSAIYQIVTDPEEDVLSGDGSLRVDLSNENPIFQSKTTWDFYGLVPGRSMYLEFDFKGDHYIEVGVLAQNPERRIFAGGANPTDEWTKLYIELTDEISSQFNSDPINIYFESRMGSSISDKTLHIDNVKFVVPF